MYTDMQFWTHVRRYVLTEGHSKRSACRKFNIHWETLEKILSHPEPPGYRRTQVRSTRKIDPVLPILHRWLEEDRQAPSKQRHTSQQLFKRLVKEHQFDGKLTIANSAGS